MADLKLKKDRNRLDSIEGQSRFVMVLPLCVSR